MISALNLDLNLTAADKAGQTVLACIAHCYAFSDTDGVSGEVAFGITMLEDDQFVGGVNFPSPLNDYAEPWLWRWFGLMPEGPAFNNGGVHLVTGTVDFRGRAMRRYRDRNDVLVLMTQGTVSNVFGLDGRVLRTA